MNQKSDERAADSVEDKARMRPLATAARRRADGGVLLAVALAFAALGCDNAEVKSFSIEPRYFCDGDDVKISWETRKIKQVQLVDNAGNVLHEASGNATSATFKVQRSQLPLDIVGTVDKTRGTLRTYHPLMAEALLWMVNVDQEYWTNEFKWDVKQGKQSPGATIPPGLKYDFKRSVAISARTDVVDEAKIDCIPQSGKPIPDGATKTIRKQYDALEAVSWDLKPGLFGARCKVIEIENCTDTSVTATFAGEKVGIPSGSSRPLLASHPAVGIVEFKLDTRREVLARTITSVLPDNCRGSGTILSCSEQTGWPTECPEVMPFGCVKLRVRCDHQP